MKATLFLYPWYLMFLLFWFYYFFYITVKNTIQSTNEHLNIIESIVLGEDVDEDEVMNTNCENNEVMDIEKDNNKFIILNENEYIPQDQNIVNSNTQKLEKNKLDCLATPT